MLDYLIFKENLSTFCRQNTAQIRYGRYGCRLLFQQNPIQTSQKHFCQCYFTYTLYILYYYLTTYFSLFTSLFKCKIVCSLNIPKFLQIKIRCDCFIFRMRDDFIHVRQQAIYKTIFLSQLIVIDVNVRT